MLTGGSRSSTESTILASMATAGSREPARATSAAIDWGRISTKTVLDLGGGARLSTAALRAPLLASLAAVSVMRMSLAISWSS